MALPVKWVKQKVEPTKLYARGAFDARRVENYGKLIGHYHTDSKIRNCPNRRAIFCAGRIQIGLVWHDVGVVTGAKDIFLGRNGELWRLQGALLKGFAPNPAHYPGEAKKVWADRVSRSVVLRLMNPHVLALEDDARKRYHAVLTAHLKNRTLEAAALGRRREAIDYAKAISPSWNRRDLVSPRNPTLRHALLFSLSLALSSDDAADLIHMAAWLEYRVPVFNREACINLYSSACRQLSMLVPEWHAHSFLCNWRVAGSIETVLEEQYCRTLNMASDRQVSAQAVLGLDLSPPASKPDLDIKSAGTAQVRFVEEL
jgi:hypothetical protein